MVSGVSGLSAAAPTAAAGGWVSLPTDRRHQASQVGTDSFLTEGDLAGSQGRHRGSQARRQATRVVLQARNPENRRGAYAVPPAPRRIPLQDRGERLGSPFKLRKCPGEGVRPAPLSRLPGLAPAWGGRRLLGPPPSQHDVTTRFPGLGTLSPGPKSGRRLLRLPSPRRSSPPSPTAPHRAGLVLRSRPEPATADSRGAGIRSCEWQLVAASACVPSIEALLAPFPRGSAGSPFPR